VITAATPRCAIGRYFQLFGIDWARERMTKNLCATAMSGKMHEEVRARAHESIDHYIALHYITLRCTILR
jgi:hypothetical protein